MRNFISSNNVTVQSPLVMKKKKHYIYIGVFGDRFWELIIVRARLQ